MERRRIGTSGPEVSVLSLGSWHTYDRMDFHDAVELIARANAAGINLFDVGVYGGVPDASGVIRYSSTDVLFGRMVERAGIARADYLLSEKLWLEGWPDRQLADQLDRALERVGTDYADFAVLGDIRTDDLDMHALVHELAELVGTGRLRAWGVNNWSVRDLRAAHDIAAGAGLPGPQMAQLKYSLCRRSIPEGEPFRALLAETGITLQASDVLEGGLLAGRRGGDRMIGRDPGGIRAAIEEAAPRVVAIAEELDVTPAQLSVAYCLRHPSLTTVLFGASRLGQLEENIAAIELAERAGDAVEAAVADLWLDRDRVDPAGP